MEYAVIKTGGKQYRVRLGDVIEVDKIETAKNGQVTFEDVLLWVADDQTKIGTPNITGVTVGAKVLEQTKGDKIRVSKFKSKVRYRKTTGFRSLLTRIQIDRIGTKTQGKEEKKEEKSAPKVKTTRSKKA